MNADKVLVAHSINMAMVLEVLATSQEMELCTCP